ncbi:PspC domain-containing protein [Moraxella sp. ZY210820]|uniref:PspC domain-containing protein n=1 Tax=unclassified Moraxella TaxID=2685852 RepID=UPI00272F6690|nr:PspC domain-containing protein [Moraxella sp. ZY210820]WLF85024.1 PspC domain-containing protein [Moraxella sp. ZY210820]
MALVRSQHNKMIAGVMAGIAERFGWDVSLVRIVFVLVSVFSVAFPGILVYLILWFIIPKAESYPDYTTQNQQNRVMKTIYPED